MAVERFPVEETHILMFARAIGDENPVYTDPSSPEAAELGGVIAPPTFTSAGMQFDPDAFLRPKLGEPWFGSAKEPSGAEIESTGRLHAEQHFEYLRPLVAGEVLRAVQRPARPGRRSPSAAAPFASRKCSSSTSASPPGSPLGRPGP